MLDKNKFDKKQAYRTPSGLGGAFSLKYLGVKNGKFHFKVSSPGWESWEYFFTEEETKIKIKKDVPFYEIGLMFPIRNPKGLEVRKLGYGKLIEQVEIKEQEPEKRKAAFKKLRAELQEKYRDHIFWRFKE